MPDDEAVDPTVPNDPIVPSPTPTESTIDPAVRDMVTQLIQASALGFDPATMTKGVVTASNPTASPPNLSLNIAGDTTTTVDGVRYIDSYSPVISDTVLIVKQGADFFVLGQMNDSGSGAANGWATSGGVSYRKIIEHGDQKVVFKGSFSATSTSLFTLGTGYTPSVTRTMVAGRDASDTSVLLQIATNGAITIRNGTVAGATATGIVVPTTDSTTPGITGGASPGGTTGTGGDAAGLTGTSTALTTGQPVGNTSGYQLEGYLSQAGSDLGHNHTIGHTHQCPGHNHTNPAGSHTHSLTTSSHTHTSTAHTHTVADVPTNSHTHTPTPFTTAATIYFDNLEFYL